MEEELQNPNPTIFDNKAKIDFARVGDEKNMNKTDPIDREEIYDIVKNILDPEHPLTLQQLNVVSLNLIKVNDNQVTVFFTPTVPNCSMSTLIGLLIKTKLMISLPKNYKIDVYIEPGKHITEDAINKQLNDKERVFAALENSQLRKILSKGIETGADFQEFSQLYA